MGPSWRPSSMALSISSLLIILWSLPNSFSALKNVVSFVSLKCYYISTKYLSQFLISRPRRVGPSLALTYVFSRVSENIIDIKETFCHSFSFSFSTLQRGGPWWRPSNMALSIFSLLIASWSLPNSFLALKDYKIFQWNKNNYSFSFWVSTRRSKSGRGR